MLGYLKRAQILKVIIYLVLKHRITAKRTHQEVTSTRKSIRQHSTGLKDKILTLHISSVNNMISAHTNQELIDIIASKSPESDQNSKIALIETIRRETQVRNKGN